MSTMKDTDDPSQHADEYSETGFRDKIKRYAKDIGAGLLRQAFRLYFASQSPNVPTWAKAAMYGALAYLVLPTDAVPDLLPMVGYTDDATVMAAALTTVAMHITPEIKQQADDKVDALLEGVDSWLNDSSSDDPTSPQSK